MKTFIKICIIIIHHENDVKYIHLESYLQLIEYFNEEKETIPIMKNVIQKLTDYYKSLEYNLFQVELAISRLKNIKMLVYIRFF